MAWAGKQNKAEKERAGEQRGTLVATGINGGCISFKNSLNVQQFCKALPLFRFFLPFAQNLHIVSQK